MDEADAKVSNCLTCKQSQGPSCGWSMSGLLTSAMAGIGLNWSPRGLTVAGESEEAREEQGEEVTKPRLKGLEGGAGRTNTALATMCRLGKVRFYKVLMFSRYHEKQA